MESLHQIKEYIQYYAQILKTSLPPHPNTRSKHDTKKLHKLINNMISGKTQNPMPPNKTNEESANEFANCFLENKNITAVIILDLSAAFDTVDHNLLLKVLDKKFGIKNITLCWYEQYLKPRRFRVCINGNYSQEKTLEFSVPQGSTQGGYLFVSYASTLDEVVPKDLQLNGYADDHSIWKCFKLEDESDTIATIESTMLDVKCWMDAVCLKMNESKTEFIYFSSKQMLKKCNISTVNINGEHSQI